MIEVHADDFCISPGASRDIIECINLGSVNGTSIMPDSPYFEECMEILKDECKKPVFLSVHLDLITGRALSGVSVLTDKEGFFNITWLKFILISLIPFYRTKYRNAVKRELSLQIDRCLPYMDQRGIRIDSHRHIHMVPMIFGVIMELIREKGLKLDYIRITKDDLRLYKGLKGFDHFQPFGLIKSLLLILFSDIDLIRFRRELSGHTADFGCILFSGKMTENNMLRVLSAKKRSKALSGRNMEIMVHPYLIKDSSEIDSIHDLEDKGYVVSHFRTEEKMAVKSRRVMDFIQYFSQE